MIGAILFLCLPHSVFQETAAPSRSFHELAHRALLENSWIRVKEARLRSISHTTQQKWDESGWRGWDLGLDAEHYPSGSGNSSIAGYDSRVSIGLTVPLLGSQVERNLRVQEVLAEKAILEAELAETKKLILVSLLGHYLTYTRGKNFEASYEEIEKALIEKRRLLQLRVTAGESLPADLLEAERDLVRHSLRVEQNREAMGLALEGMRADAGDPSLGDFEPQPLPWRERSKRPLAATQAMTERALQESPMLQGLAKKIQLLRAQEQETRGAYPRSALNVGYVTQFGGASGSDSGPAISLSMSLPLGVSRIAQERKDALAAERERYQADLDRIRQEVATTIEMRYRELGVAIEKSRLAESQWNLTQERERVAQLQAIELPDTGEVAFSLRVLDATIERLEASLQKDAAESDLAGAYLRILLSCGEGLAEFRMNCAAEEAFVPPAKESATLDLWVWDASLVTDFAERRRFFDLAPALQISGIYLGLNARETTSLWGERAERLREFLVECHERGIRVECLLAENSWALPEGRAGFEQMLQALLRFQQGAPRGARYDAIHLDIEPHSLPEWGQGPQAQAELARGYLAVLDASRVTGLPVHADLPSWYERIPVDSSNLLRAVLERVDGIVVMNYRSEMLRFREEAQAELTEASRMGKSVRLGASVESILPDSQAFRSWQSMSGMFDALSSELRSFEGFRGFAVQSYVELRKLLSQVPALGEGRGAR